MKYLIASDLHGSLRQGEKLLQAYAREGAERLLLLGDLLSGALNRQEVAGLAQLLNNMAGQILAVCGNGDSPLTQEWLDFPILDDRRILYEQGRIIFATHGHLWRESSPPPEVRQGGVLLTGHTHVPRLGLHQDFTYINPGAVFRPRGGSQAGYLLYDSGVFTWKTLDGAIFNTYRWEQQRETEL